MTVSIRVRGRERAAGREWFRALSPRDKDLLGDQFVFGTFDWRDWDNWFSRPPTAAFLNGAEEERIFWEIEESCPR